MTQIAVHDASNAIDPRYRSHTSIGAGDAAVRPGEHVGRFVFQTHLNPSSGTRLTTWSTRTTAPRPSRR